MWAAWVAGYWCGVWSGVVLVVVLGIVGLEVRRRILRELDTPDLDDRESADPHPWRRTR